jgi:hypothetical protein
VKIHGRKGWFRHLQFNFTVVISVGLISLLGFAASQPAPVPGQSDSNQKQLTHSPLFAPLIRDEKLQVASSVKQGEVLKVKLLDASQFEGHVADHGWVSLADRKAKLFVQSDGSLMALMPVSVFQKPDFYSLNVYAPRDTLVYTRKITIQDGRYRTQNVTVSKSTAGLQPLPGELEAIQALKDTISSIKYWNEPFMSPTIDCQNSPFGVKRLHNGVPTGDYHKGLDLRSPAGRPIYAITAGKVQIARMYRLHGGTVGLDHGQGVGSIYIHMSRLNVKPGDLVKKGDVIGYVGSTGFASGPHLHWGMYVSGLPVNPNQWIPHVPKCN